LLWECRRARVPGQGKSAATPRPPPQQCITTATQQLQQRTRLVFGFRGEQRQAAATAHKRAYSLLLHQS
jgi:hypothetical protein